MKYYLYRHIRLDTSEVFYVGIGTKRSVKFHYNYRSEFSRAYSKRNRNKYWENITNKTEYIVEIILESDCYEFIKNKEIEFIKVYGRRDLKEGNLVNVTHGGDGVTGLIFSKDHIRKMSDARKGKIPWNKNMKMSEEYKRILSEAHMGIKNINKGKSYEDLFGLERAKEIKEKQSIIRKGKYKGELSPNYGRKHSEETKIKQGTSIIQLDLEGNFIEKFYSITEAANITGSNISLIQKVCKGSRNKHNNFIWKYEDMENSRINSYK